MRRSPALASILMLLMADVSLAQDTPTVPLAISGEEIFGATYLPHAPDEDAAPLEPGRPSAGFQLPGSLFPTILGNVIDRTTLTRPSLRSVDVPLLRNVRRENRLPRRADDAPTGPVSTSPQDAEAAAELKIHFVNVGQGAGAILEFPCHTVLIDTGGEYASGPSTIDGGFLFAQYLDQYFDERPDRQRTIDLVITSHPHEDHLAGLRHISSATGSDAYNVRNVVDNGQTHAKGSLAAQQAFRAWATSQTPKARYSYVNFKSAVTATGVTNGVIDPVGMCRGVDPVITIFWGAYNEKIGTGEDWLNPNNHSLVVRVDFGQASFLFVGDLEDVGAKEMLREYEDNLEAFDVDVYHVSHHGAGNDTFDRFLAAMSPDFAVISMGTPAAQVRSTAWAYGHPRLKAIDVLQKQPEIVGRSRPTQSFLVASAVRNFQPATISRAIYGTGWEGTIVMRARADGAIGIDGD